MRIEKYAETPEDEYSRKVDEANKFADYLIEEFAGMRQKAGEPIKIIIDYDEPEYFMIEQSLALDEMMNHAFTNKLRVNDIVIDKRNENMGSPITVECFR